MQVDEFQKTAVEAMQQQQWRALSNNRNGEMIVHVQCREVPPLHLVHQISGLRIEQTRAELIKQCLQE